MSTATHKAVEWSALQFYEPDDFKHPEKLQASVVYGVDHLAQILNRKAVILSDFRVLSLGPTGKPSQHSLGRAIDLSYPGIDSMTVLAAIKETGRFSGFGAYINLETGGISFHVDTRTDRTPESPATWSASKDRRTGQTAWVYTSLRSIIEKHFRAAIPALVWVVIMGVGIYYLAKKA